MNTFRYTLRQLPDRTTPMGTQEMSLLPCLCLWLSIYQYDRSFKSTIGRHTDDHAKAVK